MKNNLIKTFSLIVMLVLSNNCCFASSAGNSVFDMKFVAFKFGIAMAGVAIFSIILYVGLSFYNKFFVDSQIKDYNLRKDSLRTPADKDEAIMSFICRCRLK